MQHDTADDLHAVRPHPEHAACRLTADGERLGQQIVERLPLRKPVPEFLRFCAKLAVGELLIRRFERHDGLDLRVQLLHLALRPGAE